MTARVGPRGRPDEPRLADGVAAGAVALVVRVVAVVWASSRFPPAEDGRFYHILAGRLAHGLGYTWKWPDGVVTFAAHYPVGYPALIGAAYALFGEHPFVAMAVNALLGALAAFAVHRVAAASATRVGAAAAALAFALHPGLVFYTPALMTEGVTASLVAVAAWLAVRASAEKTVRWGALTALALVLGAATLVRPQSLLLAPAFGAVAFRVGSQWLRTLAAVAVTCGTVAVCTPWTLRNCERMHSCSFVSVNAGWNLFIGAASGATGAWVPLEVLGVPLECRAVWDEAAKDACFLHAGLVAIRQAPLRFLSLVPRKLAVTFDYAGAAGFYLHSSNEAEFGDRAKLVLGVLETIWERLIVLAALVAVARTPGPRPRARRIVAGASSAWLVVRSAWIAHMGLVIAAACLGRKLVQRPAAALAASTVLSTALTHAMFFGAGRYSLVCFPVLAALAGTALTGEEEVVDNPGKEP